MRADHHQAPVLDAPAAYKEKRQLGFSPPGHNRPPEWPRGDHDSQQAHLDLDVPDIERAQEAVLALGATPLDVDDHGGERMFRVYADPAGHPFCLCLL